MLLAMLSHSKVSTVARLSCGPACHGFSAPRQAAAAPAPRARQGRFVHLMPARAVSALEEMGNKGEFKRTESTYRNWIKKGDSKYPPEAGRYHLYISWACPWANRAVAAIYLKGLEDVIGLSATHPTWQKTRPNDPDDTHWGWTFATESDAPFVTLNGARVKPKTGLLPDTLNHTKNIRELYDKTDGNPSKFTVPLLWDKKTGTIVNNESADLLRMLNSEFNDFAQKPDLDLYPEVLRKSIEEVNSWVYPNINNGVYRTGFATSQEAYEEAFEALFEHLDKAEGILAKQKFIAGDQLTEADVRLFMTLIRFDWCYHTYFKTNKRFIHQYEALRDYVREMYAIPGIKRAVNLEHCKLHYHTSHPRLNYYAIVPVGPPHWHEQPPSGKRLH